MLINNVMERIFEIFRRVQSWVSAHWRVVMALLCMIVLMQQCTINRLHWELDRLSRPLRPDAAAADSVGRAMADTASAPAAVADTASAPAAVADTASAAVRQGGAASAGSFPVWGVVLIVLAAASVVGAVAYMWVNAIFPVGLSFRGRLAQNAQGQLVFSIRVRNRSRKVVELDRAQVNFVMGPSQVRRFRAGVPSLPISLQPKTTYEAQINLTGLISANIELCKAKAISLSLMANGRMHSTLPRPVKFKTA